MVVAKSRADRQVLYWGEYVLKEPGYGAAGPAFLECKRVVRIELHGGGADARRRRSDRVGYDKLKELAWCDSLCLSTGLESVTAVESVDADNQTLPGVLAILIS